MRNIKNLTYHNMMIVIHKIQKKGYSFSESERLAKQIFSEFLARPLGMSINARINQILTKEEWIKENNLWGNC